MADLTRQPTRQQVIARRLGQGLAIVHALLFVFMIPLGTGGGRGESFVWAFVFLDFPVSIPFYVLFDMVLGLFHSAPLVLWLIYLGVGTAWQLYWPRLVVATVTPR